MSAFEKKIADAVIDLQNRQLGAVFTISTTIIGYGLTQATLNITEKSVNGELEIEDIILKTDGTGLAGAATFVIESDNAKGTTTVMAVGIPRLGARATVDYELARKVEQLGYEKYGRDAFGTSGIGAGTGNLFANNKTILESAKALAVRTTGAASTGAGKIDIYIKFRRLAAGASIKAAID